MEKVNCWKFEDGVALTRMTFEPDTQPATLDQASFLIPAGAYTTFRTYGKTSVFHLSGHLTRLEDTARFSGRPVDLPRSNLRAALRSALTAAPWPECRVRVTLDMESGGMLFFIFLEELRTPTLEQYRDGVNVCTVHTRRENPLAKLSSFLPVAKYYREQAEKSAYEYLMVAEDGTLLEGMSSNFFGVQEGQLRTAGSGVLEGITRTSVLDAARGLGIPVAFDAVRLDQAQGLDEAFITSSGRGILPVVLIDDVVIGSSRPGPITQRLSEEFNRRLGEGLEEI